MDSLLETVRLLHEERERLLDEMVKELSHKKKNHRAEINAGHRFLMHLNRYMACSKKLVNIYEDKDNLLKDEVLSISNGNEFPEFYGRIRQVKEFHRQYPDTVDSLAKEFDVFRKIREKNSEEDNMVEFTDEESYGKYVDIDFLYQRFMNLDAVRTNERYSRMTYLEYLSCISRFYDLPFDLKNTEEYADYIRSVKQYFIDFIKKAKPLLDIDMELKENLKQFDSQWACGDFPGWNSVILNNILYHTASKPEVRQFVDLNQFNSPKSLESLGPEELKNILEAVGLKCGGTLTQRAERLFALKDKTIDDLDASYFPSKRPKLNHNGISSHQKYKSIEDYKKLALEEGQICVLLDILKEEIEGTRDNIERKQARTAEEILKEDDLGELEEPIHFDNTDFHDNTLYNPKNLPLDFDGKPIPYWLYKLHGLNIYYNCEICGNTKYRGPKAFQRHFGEWKHAHGMRTLGIPNTSHFVNITKIQDAYNLWDMIKNTKLKEQWNADNDEEFEDSDGNPINKRIFDDLRRQGLL